MARWEPGYFQAQDTATRRLIEAHPEEYQHLVEKAKAELPAAEPCEICAWLGVDALELADLLGHDKQGHQAFRALWSHQILSVAALLAALDDDLGLYYLHGRGLGAGGPTSAAACRLICCGHDTDPDSDAPRRLRSAHGR
ncbi:hypothetical protein [Streptomyces sp. NPDC007904]|jgi:hypothetical protein|uniref:hypothetical protein n=1 Tax=Streptomyces sp. NPDC007904 TaxID=3364787 RepID=UPI0036EEEB21